MFGEVANPSLALSFELLAKELFGGARFAGEGREGDQERFRDAARADFVDGDRLFFGTALKDDGVKILDAAR